MDVYSYTDYKPLLKDRMKDLRARGGTWTFRRLAGHLRLQPTYLSKVLNNESSHLSEDDLWTACKTLDFFPEEIEYALLLRSRATATQSERRQDLSLRIEKKRDERKLNAETASSSVLTNEMDYLLNPLCLVLSAALASETLRRDVRALAPKLGLRLPQLRDLLRVLERNDRIRLDPDDPFHVLKVHSRRTHFPKGHPLLRTHQTLFKNMILSRLATTPEDEKQSLLVTFTMDAASFAALKKEFQAFLKTAEEISKRSRHDEVYQLSFDLFRWL